MAESTEQRPRKEAESLRAQVVAALKTHLGLQQAFLLAEILTPPVAKRRARPRPDTHRRLVCVIACLWVAAFSMMVMALDVCPKSPNCYWTFTTAAGETPTLPMVAFQLFAVNVHVAAASQCPRLSDRGVRGDAARRGCSFPAANTCRA
jgi:hypothetical protein